MNTLTTYLNQKLKRSGYDKAEIARAASVPYSTISNIFVGKTDIRNTSFKVLITICRYLHIKIDDIIHFDEVEHMNSQILSEDAIQIAFKKYQFPLDTMQMLQTYLNLRKLYKMGTATTDQYSQMLFLFQNIDSDIKMWFSCNQFDQSTFDQLRAMLKEI